LRAVETTCVRFDDLSPGGSGSFGLTGEIDEFTARREEDVVPVLAAAEAAATAGYWVAGYVSYEAAPALNPLLTVRPRGLHDPMRDLPLAQFRAFTTRLELPEIDTLHYPAGTYSVSGWSPDSSRRDYRDSLAVTGRAIMSGEIERGKHTFRLHAAFNGDQTALYRDLLQSQRGPHGACLETGRFGLISVSPERFFKVSDGVLSVRPVLSSIRRGRWLEEDAEFESMLGSNGSVGYVDRVLLAESEAELTQLGTLLPPGESPIVSQDRMELLWHLTARIGVRLDAGVDLRRIFEVLFPPLSVTGVPKPEAMEVIATTEDTARGVYCGTIGFIAPRGVGGTQASFSVAIRTVVVDNEEGVAEYGVGTAITNASDVVSAYEEARLKARVLVDRRPDFQLIERFREDDGEVVQLDTKLGILDESARYFGYELDLEGAAGALEEAATGGGSRELELRVNRTGGFEIATRSVPSWAGTLADAPVVSGCVCADRVSADNVFLFHKTTDRRLRDATSRQHQDVEVVILVNEEGEVAGSLDGNVVIDLDGTWLTPPRRCGNAVYALRRNLVASGEVRERVLTEDDLARADHVVLVDDIDGWRLIRLKD
jgi:para-aminobenzoate synthetase/4-amino-4-deoxychorismate lyase